MATISEDYGCTRVLVICDTACDSTPTATIATCDNFDVSETNIAYSDIETYHEPEQDIEDFEHEYYLEVPKNIYPVKNFIMKTEFNIKQPIARAGFKRGQRK